MTVRPVSLASLASLVSLASLASLLMSSACDTVGSPTSRQLSVEPTVAEQQLLGAASSHRTEADPLLSAVAIGGPRDPNELGAMARALDVQLTAITQSAALFRDPAARARAILESMFAPRGGQPLLASYHADATTLSEVITTGRFNCVSATMLYILAAKRAGIDARPVLLPSHARALVVIGGRAFVVETTTMHGFDAPPSVSREALDRARPKGLGPHVDLYADERGTEVDWNALLGIAYGNLGIMAQARGETALAAALLAREGALTPPAQVPLVKAQEASLLTELATRALSEGRWGEALGLAMRADVAAPDAAMKRLTRQNIAAIASQQLAAQSGAMDDTALLAFAEPLRSYPGAYGDVRALALTKLGERRLQRGDVEGSSAALKEAASLASSDEVRGATVHNARLGELNRLGRLSATDPERAFAEWSALGPPDPTLAETEAEVSQTIVQNRAVHFANQGRCADLEKVLTSRNPLPRDAPLRAGCHARTGITLSDRGDNLAAIAELRTAVRLDAADPRHKQNLAVVIEKEVDRLVKAGRCSEIAQLLAEGRALEPGDTFFDEVTTFCQHAR